MRIAVRVTNLTQRWADWPTRSMAWLSDCIAWATTGLKVTAAQEDEQVPVRPFVPLLICHWFSICSMSSPLTAFRYLSPSVCWDMSSNDGKLRTTLNWYPGSNPGPYPRVCSIVQSIDAQSQSRKRQMFQCLSVVSIGSASIHPLVTVTQNCMDQKSTDSSPNHSQVSRNSSKKSNSSLLVHSSMYCLVQLFQLFSIDHFHRYYCYDYDKCNLDNCKIW